MSKNLCMALKYNFGVNTATGCSLVFPTWKLCSKLCKKQNVHPFVSEPMDFNIKIKPRILYFEETLKYKGIPSFCV